MKSTMVQICADCEAPFEWQGKKRNGICLECSIKRLMTVIGQMQRREGPYYEKWLESCERAVERFAASQKKALAHYKQSLERMTYDATPLGQAEATLRLAAIERYLKEEGRG